MIIGMGMFGGIAALPLYLQIVKGATPTHSGLLTLPLVLGIMSMSMFSGRVISRTGAVRRWPVLGVSLMIVGLLLLAGVGVDTPLWLTMCFMLVFGLGLGASMQPLILSVQSAMPAVDMGVATASTTFFRQLGGTLGTAVLLSVLFSTVGGKVAGAYSRVAGTPGFQAAVADAGVRSNPDDQAALGALTGTGASRFLDDSSFLSRIDPRLARPFLEGFAGSMTLVFLVAAVVLVAALALVLLMPDTELRSVSGIEARQAAEAETAAAPGQVASSEQIAARAER
jgi:hypothetical protein